MRKIILILIFSVFLISFTSAIWADNGSAVQSVSGCNLLNTTNGTYTLTTDLSITSGACFTINANNITLNMNNYNISGSGQNTTGGNGINIAAFNYTSVKNGELYNFYYGINLSRSNASILENITSNSNVYGVYLTKSSNSTLTNITANSNIYGIIEDTNSNATLTNITANSNRYGISLFTASNNTLSNIGASFNYDGFYLSASSNNNFTNITANSNNYAFYFTTTSNNSFTKGNLKANIKLLDRLSNSVLNNLTNNTFDKTLNGIIINKTVEQQETYSQNSNVFLNLSIYMMNRTIEPNFIINNISIYPTTDYTNSTTNNNLTINFTATKLGIYNVKLNISDSLGNTETKKYSFFVGNLSSDFVRYYFHADLPTHGQSMNPSPLSYDSGSLLLSPVTSSEFRTCTFWIQFSPDEILKPLGIIENISINWWYKSSVVATSNIEKYVDYSNSIDYSNSLPISVNYVWNSTNFTNLNITSDYLWRIYGLSLKLKTSDIDSPTVMSNETKSSYADFEYLYTGPNITQFTEENGSEIQNVELLSSYYENDEKTNVTLQLDGEGNFTIALNLTPTTYAIYYDDVNCSLVEDNCSVNTNLDGDINVTVAVGSFHTLKIIDNETPTITFSCTPTSVKAGSTITCSCSAVDDIDSSPTISYTTNPSTTTIGDFTTTCTVTDAAGNSGSSSVSYTVSNSGNGDTTSSGNTNIWTSTYWATEEQFTEGFTREQGELERIRISVDDEQHYVGITDIYDNFILINVSSTTQQANLSIGEEEKFDVNEDDYYDISVLLNSINNTKANITIKSINEKVVVEEEDSGQDNNISGEGDNNTSTEKTNYKKYIIIAIVVVFVGIVVSVIYKRKRK